MEQLSEGARAFLNQPRFAIAATIGEDGMPHQTVVWYLPDGDTVIVNTPEGSLKHRHLLRDPRMSLCIEDGYQYVTLSGTASLEADPGRAVYNRLGERYQSTFAARASIAPATLSPRTAELLSRERVVIRLKIEHVLVNGIG